MSAKRIASSGRMKIVSIFVTGYQKIKEPQKHHVFIVDVTWNNGERYEIYRRYSDFFSFHTTLKAMIQAAAGRGSEERTIPQFPKRNFVWRSQATRVTEAKLEQFNRYCQDILSLGASVSESAHVIGFFTPRGGDRQLPSVQFRRTSAPLEPKNEPVKQLEEYRALAEFNAEDGSQVSFKEGDKVLVKSKDKSGWWLCKANGKTGWAPPTFLKKYTNDIENSTDSSGYLKISHPSSRKKHVSSQNSRETEEYAPSSPKSLTEEDGGGVDPEITAEEYKAIEDYEADGPGQVSFKEGDIIQVMDKLEDGWWFVSIGQEEGWAPCSYMEKLNGQDEEEEFTSSGEEKYHTVEGYEAEEEDELSFPKGAVINVIQKRLDGWWFVKYKDKTGLAPGTYLRKGLPPAKLKPLPKTPEESDPRRGSDRRKETVLAYENMIQLQMAKAQPPRRKSVRHWAAEKRSNRPNPQQRRSPLADTRTQRTPQYHSYTNCQPNLLGPVTSDSDKSKTLGAIRELNEEHGGGQHYGSFHSERGDGKRDGRGGSAKRPIAAPRSRVPHQLSLPSTESPEEHYARPKIKERSHSNESISPTVAPRKSSSPQVNISVYDTVPSVYNERHDKPPPRSNYDVPRLPSNKDKPPPLGPGHPLRPNADAPRLPPRPTPSVYKRAKENSKLETERSHDSQSVSGLTTSSWSHPSQEKGHRRIKKSKSQTPADERFQAIRPTSQAPITRVRSIGGLSSTEDGLHSTPPQDTLGGATGVGGNPFSDEITGTLLKYILSSPDPTLKETLKNLITNNEAIKTSLQ